MEEKGKTKEEQDTLKEGKFTLEKAFFFTDGRKLYIGERKNTKGKPKHYLFQLLPEKKYLSSLFPTEEPNNYMFDYMNKLYRMKIEGSQLEISIVE